MELTFTSEQLKDGSAVRKLIERFQKKNTPENLTALFKVFNYITVIVPVTINEEKSGEIDATSGKREYLSHRTKLRIQKAIFTFLFSQAVTR